MYSFLHRIIEIRSYMDNSNKEITEKLLIIIIFNIV